MKTYTSILHDVQASYRGSSKQALVQRSQSLLQIYLLKPASLYLTPLFVWLRFSPNQVTVLGFLVGLAACLLLAGPAPSAALGAWLYLAHRVLDHVDGNLARYGERTSSFGQFLDDSLGALIQMALFLSVGMGAYQQALVGEVTFAGLARYPGLALLAGALASSTWMLERLIHLQYSRIFERAASTDDSARSTSAIDPAAQVAPENSTAKLSAKFTAQFTAQFTTLWKRAKAVNGVVPVIRVFGLVLAAHLGLLVFYLAFFAVYVPLAFLAQYARLLRLARRPGRRTGALALER